MPAKLYYLKCVTCGHIFTFFKKRLYLICPQCNSAYMYKHKADKYVLVYKKEVIKDD